MGILKALPGYYSSVRSVPGMGLAVYLHGPAGTTDGGWTTADGGTVHELRVWALWFLSRMRGKAGRVCSAYALLYNGGRSLSLSRVLSKCPYPSVPPTALVLMYPVQSCIVEGFLPRVHEPDASVIGVRAIFVAKSASLPLVSTLLKVQRVWEGS